MTDFINTLRGRQQVLAHELSLPLLQDLAEHFDDRLQEAASEARLDARTLDRDAAREFLEDQIDRDVFAAVLGYSTWLATQLYRRHLASGAPLNDRETIPECSSKDMELISAKYGTERATVDAIVAAMHSRPDLVLPGVGVLRNGEISIDAEALNRWAAHYDWAKPAG